MKFLFCLWLALGSVLQAMSKAPPEQIGVRTLKYEDIKRGWPVWVELWYPTRQLGPIDNHPPDSIWVHPKEIRDVPISDGRHPLIVMSHGHGGDRRDRSWLAEHLVKSGFIVASVEHHGNCWRNYNPLISLRFWERARDISFTISQLLEDAGIQKWIDARRIGFVGYSLGGMTGLALAGARAQNVKEIAKRHAEMDEQFLEQVDFSEAQGDFTDRRIRAMALLSPAAFVFPPQSLEKVKVPVALVASKGDEVLPFQEHAHKIIAHLAPIKLKLLRDHVSHYVFLNRISDEGKALIREEIQADLIEADRLEVHREVGAFVVNFFQEQLR